MLLGKIVRSNSHIDYVGQIYAPGEVAQPPAPANYAFGTFVRVALDPSAQTWLVGLIYNTVLLNPDFGNLGPRLSPPTELAVFSPDYLQEKATLVGIIAVGTLTAAGVAFQGIPAQAALTDALVETLDCDQVKTFHQSNPAIRLVYLPLLLHQGTPLTVYLLRGVIDQLQQLFPQQARSLAVLQRELRWQSQVSPLGGRL